MLELLSWRDLNLKTRAMEFLIRIFHLRTSFSRAIEATIFVCDQGVASHFYRVRALLVDFRRNAQYLRCNAENGASDDVSFHVAMSRVLYVLANYQRMLLDCAGEGARLLQLQCVMSDVGVFNEAVALLRIPWTRSSSTESHKGENVGIITTRLDICCRNMIRISYCLRTCRLAKRRVGREIVLARLLTGSKRIHARY